MRFDFVKYLFKGLKIVYDVHCTFCTVYEYHVQYKIQNYAQKLQYNI